MQIIVLLVALLATMLAGCPNYGYGPTDPVSAAPWNDPYRDQPQGSTSSPSSSSGNYRGGYTGPEYHYVWVEQSVLRVKFRSGEFQARRTLETGGGYDMVDTVHWTLSIATDSGEGRLRGDRGHAREFFLTPPNGKWIDGERFRIGFLNPGIVSFLETTGTIAGPGVRVYDREKFVFDSSKTY